MADMQAIETADVQGYVYINQKTGALAKVVHSGAAPSYKGWTRLSTINLGYGLRLSSR